MALLGAPQVLYPLWFDQGAFAACADVLRRGGSLYRDCWEVRGAATPVIYALARTVSATPYSVRLLDLAWQWLTACAIMQSAMRLFGTRRAGFIAGALYVLMVASLNYWATAQAEGFANLFIVLSILLALRSAAPDSRSATVAAGLCCGLLFWFKYPFVAFVVLPAGIIWRRGGTQSRCTQFSLLMAGVLASVIGGFALLAVQGTLADWLLHFQYDLATFNNAGLAERWAWFTSLFRVEILAFLRQGNTPTAGWKDTLPDIEWLGRGYPFLFAAIAAGALQVVTGAPKLGARLFVLFHLFFGVLMNIWQGHSYRYHFVIWLPALALCAAASLSDPAKRPANLIGSALCGLAMLGMLATTLPWIADAAQNIVFERKPFRTIYAESKLREYFDLADFLRGKTAPAESIVIFSDVPAVYALAERPMGTRFSYMRWADEGRDPQIIAIYSEQLLADILQNKPKYFILTKHGFPWPEARFIDAWKRLVGVHAHVEQNYHYALDVGNFIIFERN